MSRPENNAENDLSTTLKRQADEFARRGGHDLELAQVVSRAGEIRRGRRMRASMVMAAVVVAIAVPVGITVIGDNPNTPKPGPPIATNPTQAPNTDRIGVNGLRTGELPALGYFEAGTLHHGGAEIPVGNGGEVRGIARMNGGFLVSRQAVDGSGDLTATFFGDDQEAAPGESWPLSGGFAVSTDGNVGAFVEPNGTVVVVQDAGALHYELGRLSAPGSPTWDVGAVTGENCSGRSEETGCTVYVNDRNAQQGFYSITDHGTVVSLQRSITSLNAAHGDLLAGIISVSDDGSCSAVTTTADTTRWSTCKEQLLAFSPDGRHLLGAQAYGDGLGDNQLVVLDAKNGHPVLDLSVEDGFTIRTATWEDDDHLLALVSTGNKYAVIRFALDGDRELALAVKSGIDDLSPPFLIPGS